MHCINLEINVCIKNDTLPFLCRFYLARIFFYFLSFETFCSVCWAVTNQFCFQIFIRWQIQISIPVNSWSIQTVLRSNLFYLLGVLNYFKSSIALLYKLEFLSLIVAFFRENAPYGLDPQFNKSLNESAFNFKNPTKIITHGFMSSIKYDVFMLIKNGKWKLRW